MSKEKKPRSKKYEEKVHLNTSFGKAIELLAKDANKRVQQKIDTKKQ